MGPARLQHVFFQVRRHVDHHAAPHHGRDTLDPVGFQASSLALVPGGVQAAMELHVLCDVAEGVDVRARVAGAEERIHRRTRAARVHEVTVLPDHGVSERTVERHVGHSGKKLDAQIEHPAAARDGAQVF